MLLSRLLVLAWLPLLFSAALVAQSQSADATSLRPSQDVRQAYPGGRAFDQFSFNQAPSADGEHSTRLRNLESEWQGPSVECYAIRSYVVVRDTLHSDSTHAGGYSTCVAAARIRMYSTVAREER